MVFSSVFFRIVRFRDLGRISEDRNSQMNTDTETGSFAVSLTIGWL